MLRAVIFDFDGVITDSELLHLSAFNTVLARYGIEISKQDYYKQYLGLSDADVFRLLKERDMLGPDAETREELIRRKNRAFDDLVKKGCVIMAGVRDFLEMLKSNRIPMAIFSGALMAEIELILNQSGLRHFFEQIVSAEQVKRGKPHPDGFLLALSKLNAAKRPAIAACQCVVIEDSQWGLNAAISAGMHTVAVTSSYSADELSMAEKIVTSLSELSIAEIEGLCC